MKTDKCHELCLHNNELLPLYLAYSLTSVNQIIGNQSKCKNNMIHEIFFFLISNRVFVTVNAF